METDNKRRETRYSLSDEIRDHYCSRESCYVEIELDAPVRGTIVDISLSGLGFEVEDPAPQAYERLQGDDSYIIRIQLGGEACMAEARKAWLSPGAGTIKGGVVFNVMSHEDRTRLSQFIEEMRKRI